MTCVICSTPDVDEHKLQYKDINDKTHTEYCELCEYEATVPHDFSSGDCVCGQSGKVTYIRAEKVSDLADGQQILLVYKNNNEIIVNGTFNTKYLEIVKGGTLSSDGKTYTDVPETAQELTLGISDGKYTFAIDGVLLGLTGTGNGSLSNNNSKRTTTWTITITQGVAYIASTLATNTNTCRFQCNTSYGFTNYKTSTQKDPSIFIKQ